MLLSSLSNVAHPVDEVSAPWDSPVRPAGLDHPHRRSAAVRDLLLRNFSSRCRRPDRAARIDGATNIGIFRNIVLPLSVPALASYAIFQFLWVWNDLLVALVFAPRPAGQPMTTQIGSLLGTYGSEWHILAAASFLIMVVPLAVFFSLQRFFVQGLLAGSVK